MSAFQKFNDFVEEVLKGTHDFSGDIFKLMLSNSAPTASNSLKADITEIAAGNGYVAGGASCSVALTRSSGVAKVAIADITFTATGAMAAFRYGIIYNDSAGSKNLVGWFDHGSAVSLTSGETFTADFDGTNGVFTLA